MWKRLIEFKYDSFMIVPVIWWQCGIQIEILEKNNLNKTYNSNIITEGFTRIIYFENGKVPSTSRLSYEWYSSNESVATVTNYGTVLAKNVNSRQTVLIYAVYKNDSSIIFVQGLIVDNYSGPEIIIEKIISISNDLPYNFNQYYLWNSDNTNITTVNQFRKVKAINNGGCIISGNYTPNSMVIVKIYITVV